MIEVVLNVEYGGFHLDDEMVDYLCNNCYFMRGHFDSVSKNWWVLKPYEKTDSFDFRSSVGLVNCVRELQNKYDNCEYNCRDHKVHDLKIVEVDPPEYHIVDYYDGKERVEIR